MAEGDKNKGSTRRMPGESRHHQKDFTFSFDEHSQKSILLYKLHH